MWVLIVLTFGFVSTDKVIFEEFSSKERCEAAKQTVLRLDAQWKRQNVSSQDLIGNKNLTPQMECQPK